MRTNNQISPMQFCCNTGFTLPNNPKDLDPSDKTDLDFWDCFGRKKHRLISEEIRYMVFCLSCIIHQKILLRHKDHQKSEKQTLFGPNLLT